MTTTLSPFHERLNEVAGKASYRKLGKLTETHPETVRRYMQGQTPSSTYIMAFCDALGVSGDWLLTGKGPKFRNQVRTHALKHADASELLNAIADTLTLLTARVDTMERFMQSLETRLGPVLRSFQNDGASDSGILQPTASASTGESLETHERATRQPGDLQPGDAIERIRGVIGNADEGVGGQSVAQRASAPVD